MSFVGNDRFTSSGGVGSTFPKPSGRSGNGFFPTSHTGLAAGVTEVAAGVVPVDVGAGGGGVEDVAGAGCGAGAPQPASTTRRINHRRTTES
ncbi:hypothetical protein GCM10029964_103620 [Kibdelosporangium lantanae]